MTDGTRRVTISAMPLLIPWVLLSSMSLAGSAGGVQPAPDPPQSSPASEDPQTAVVAESSPPVTPAPPSPPVAETWAGILSVMGSRKIPLLGKIKFQTDNFVMAAATKISDSEWEVSQSTCAIRFPKTMGAQIEMDPAAAAKMPHGTLRWKIDPDGGWTAGPWKSGWDDSDHDLDGHPGITLKVSAPFCGGDLYASSDAEQSAWGKPEPGHVVSGELTVYVEQKTLGARGPCLTLMAKDSISTMNGKFAFKRVDKDATCDSVTEWPEVVW